MFSNSLRLSLLDGLSLGKAAFTCAAPTKLDQPPQTDAAARCPHLPFPPTSALQNFCIGWVIGQCAPSRSMGRINILSSSCRNGRMRSV
ncbi:hypothetical protein QBC34DRAFT_412108 [Podospora aff. communis PSN243]|uniref:Secreted protein n=1 Tax=Podospora aff. communis PSN243 TaxID=3040156 RepID=A0AAV9GG03_9PEZI|nr:hypothetical protein QBC34DRAFT_412108 [Podospora aff. communis PSN243]